MRKKYFFVEIQTNFLLVLSNVEFHHEVARHNTRVGEVINEN